MRRIDLLDYARLLAALMVVGFHYTYNGYTNGKITASNPFGALTSITQYGYLGVDLFFLISGYVIYQSASNKSAIDFIKGRALRIYPAYWAAVILTSLFALRWGGINMGVTVTQVLSNLTLLHWIFDVSHVDGVYWSLVYEIIFYFSVSLILLTPLKKHLALVFMLWPFLQLAITQIIGWQTLPLLTGYYCLFAAGAVLAIDHKRFNIATYAITLTIATINCIHFARGKADELSLAKGNVFSPNVVTIMIAFFLIFFICTKFDVIASIKLPLAKTAGGITYPLYLIHAHIGYMFLNQFINPNNATLLATFLGITMIFTAFLIHKHWEPALNLIIRRI